MNTLSLTFRGPFLFCVPPGQDGVPSPTATIYAPQCPGHSGSVFWGDGSLALYGRRRLGGKFPYALTGPVANAGKISYQWDYKRQPACPILCPERPESTDCHPTDEKLLSSAYFSIRVPRPRIFYAMNLVNDTEVVQQGDCQNVFPLWATAFRLYYDWPPEAKIILNTPAVPPDCHSTPNLVTPPIGSRPTEPPDWLPLPNVGDVEFQFESSGGDDLQHEDATSCFEAITSLVNLDWWLNFDNGEIQGGGAIHSGGDCMAIPIVVGMNN